MFIQELGSILLNVVKVVLILVEVLTNIGMLLDDNSIITWLHPTHIYSD